MSDSILSATSPRNSRIVGSPVDAILPQYVNYGVIVLLYKIWRLKLISS